MSVSEFVRSLRCLQKKKTSNPFSRCPKWSETSPVYKSYLVNDNADLFRAYRNVLKSFIDHLEKSALFFHRNKAVATKTKCPEIRYAILFKTLLDKEFFFTEKRYIEYSVEKLKLEAGESIYEDFNCFMNRTHSFFDRNEGDILRELETFYEEGRILKGMFDSESFLNVLRFRADLKLAEAKKEFDGP